MEAIYQASRRLISAGFILPAVFAFLAAAAFPQVEESPDFVAIHGGTDPSGIPQFLAWRSFFMALDDIDLYNGLEAYVKKNRLNLEEILNQSEHPEELFQLIGQTAIAASREQKKLQNQVADWSHAYQEGVVTDLEKYRDVRRAILRQEVSNLSKSCLSLENALLERDPIVAPIVLRRLAEFVRTEYKQGMTMATHLTDDDVEYLAVISEFECLAGWEE